MAGASVWGWEGSRVAILALWRIRSSWKKLGPASMGGELVGWRLGREYIDGFMGALRAGDLYFGERASVIL